MMKTLIHQIPNLFTLANLCLGAAAIASLVDYPERSYIFFAFCLVCDFLDGLVAKLLKAQTEIGAQLDSLADMVSFGVFPAALVLHCAGGMSTYGDILVYLSAFLYVVCAAIRLAKFNIEEPGSHFSGLPSPAAAIAVVTLVYSVNSLQVDTEMILPLVISGCLALALLMVMPFRVLSFKSKQVLTSAIHWVLIVGSLGLVAFFGILGFALSVALLIFLSLLDTIRHNFIQEKR